MCLFLFVVNQDIQKSACQNMHAVCMTIQKSPNLYSTTAFLFLLDFQHRLHLSNVIMYCKYINVREGILLFHAVQIKLTELELGTSVIIGHIH